MASTRTPISGEVGPGFRGPQPGTACKDGDKVAPSACDDGPHGRGAGGQLRYRVTVAAGDRETVWIAVAAPRLASPRARRRAQATPTRSCGEDPQAQPARRPLAAQPARRPPAAGVDRLGQAEPRRPDPDRDRSPDPVRRPGQGLSGADRDRRARDVRRRRLPGLPVAVRHRRRVHRVRERRARPVRADQVAPARAARRLGPAQRPFRQGRARDRHRRLGVLRGERRRRQHRRVGQVPERGRARVALDRRRPLPRRPLRLLAARAAPRDGPARRRQGRLARRPRQRRARRAWARRSSTTPST